MPLLLPPKREETAAGCSGYGWACERTPADREKEREFYGIYFNEYHSLKNGKGEELEALPDYLEKKPSFDRKA